MFLASLRSSPTHCLPAVRTGHVRLCRLCASLLLHLSLTRSAIAIHIHFTHVNIASNSVWRLRSCRLELVAFASSSSYSRSRAVLSRYSAFASLLRQRSIRIRASRSSPHVLARHPTPRHDSSLWLWLCLLKYKVRSMNHTHWTRMSMSWIWDWDMERCVRKARGEHSAQSTAHRA